MSNAPKVTLSEREQLEQLHNALGTVPEPEDIRAGEDPAVTEEREFEMDRVAAQIADEERDKEIAKLKSDMERQNEIIQRLLQSGRVTAPEIADQLNEHDMMMQRRKLYEKVKAHGDKIRIVLFSHSDPKQNRDVPIKHANNPMRMLPRNKVITVSSGELEILDNAIAITEERLVDPSGNVQFVKNRIPSYPFHIADHEFMENA